MKPQTLAELREIAYRDEAVCVTVRTSDLKELIAHIDAQQAKPIVKFGRVLSIGEFDNGKQFVRLSKTKGHPRLGDSEWVRTSPIVRIETANSVYEVEQRA